MWEDNTDKFNGDLASGELFEEIFKTWANRTHRDCRYQKQDGDFKPYDLKCGHCQIKVECKSDRQQSRTGNFFFEGPLLKGSEAEWLAYRVWRYDGDEDDPSSEYGTRRIYTETDYFWLFDLNQLREWCRQYYLEHKTAWVANAGDGGRSSGLLVPTRIATKLPFAVCVNYKTTTKQYLDKTGRMGNETIQQYKEQTAYRPSR